MIGSIITQLIINQQSFVTYSPPFFPHVLMVNESQFRISQLIMKTNEAFEHCEKLGCLNMDIWGKQQTNTY